jgi:hypothetical protein
MSQALSGTLNSAVFQTGRVPKNTFNMTVGLRLMGVGFSDDHRTYTPTASYTGISAQREDTDETSWWIQVRRSMTETISGSIRYTGSSRDGSNWLAPASSGVGLVTVGDPSQLGPNAIFMPAAIAIARLRLMLN